MVPIDRHVVLLGLMGAGKSSVGRRVAAHLDRPFLDGDVELEARTGGPTAADVADAEGIEHLHGLEADIALACLATTTPAVIAPAASVIEVERVRAALADHLVVWLAAPAEHLAERAGRKDHRPLLDDADPVALFERQLAVREPLARAVADLVLDVTALSKDEQADAVVALV